MSHTLSIIIPCLNEEKNLEFTYNEVLAALGTKFTNYEILFVDDGSTDGTHALMQKLASSNPNVRVLRNETNKGFGYTYWRGVMEARMDFVGMIPGDSEILGPSVDEIFSNVGWTDMTLSYSLNMEVRPYLRRLTSRLFTFVMNTLFVCDVQYFNGPLIARRELLVKNRLNSNGFGFQVPLLTRLIRSGASFTEVGIFLRPRVYGKSSALKLKNVISILKDIVGLAVKVYVTEKHLYSHDPKRIILFNLAGKSPPFFIPSRRSTSKNEQINAVEYITTIH